MGLFLGPWAGAVVSRTRDLRRLLITTQFVSAAAPATMGPPVRGGAGRGLAYSGASALGLAYCFALPAASVLIPSFIPGPESAPETKRAIRAAMALDHTSYNIGRCAAPLLAVLVVTRIGFGWAFELNAVSFLALIAAVFMARPRSVPRNDQAKMMDGFRGHAGIPDSS